MRSLQSFQCLTLLSSSLAFYGKPEEVIASDLVAGGFHTDVGEGGVKLAIPLVAAIEYVCSG